MLCAALVARQGEVTGPQITGNFLAQWLCDGVIAQISDRTL
jgi:hypothetical protein